MNLKTFKKKFFKSIYHAQNTLFISTECPFHTLVLTGCDIFKYSSIHHYIIFYGYNWSTSVNFTNLKKS